MKISAPRSESSTKTFKGPAGNPKTRELRQNSQPLTKRMEHETFTYCNRQHSLVLCQVTLKVRMSKFGPRTHRPAVQQQLAKSRVSNYWALTQVTACIFFDRPLAAECLAVADAVNFFICMIRSLVSGGAEGPRKPKPCTL